MTRGRVLSHQEARAFYDRLGSRLESQRFYEDPAMAVLLATGAFEDASAVVEFGCGTGRLAERLLRERLPSHATYVGFDVSPTMVELARSRLAPWKERALVHLTAGAPALPVADHAFDRFLSTYVLDLLSQEEIDEVLSEARRVLSPNGWLCLASLTWGQTPISRLVCGVWSRIDAWRPQLVGGCRPLRLDALAGPSWRAHARRVICTFGICTEVLVSLPRGAEEER